MTDKPNFVTAPELAERYRVALDTVHRWGRERTDGFPAPLRVGRVVRWVETEVEEWEATRHGQPRYAETARGGESA